MSGDLRSKVARGVVIKLLGALPSNILSTTLTLLCVRVLTPSSYGAYSLAVAIFGFSDVLTNPPIPSFLIRKPDCSDRDIDVAITLSALRGVVVMAAMWLLAPYLTRAFGGAPVVTTMLRVMSINFVVGGLKNLHVIRFHRDLRFGMVTLVESTGGFVGTILSISLLLWLREPLVLVFGGLTGASLAVIISWIFGPMKPRFTYDLSAMAESWRFTRYLLAHSLIIYALLNLDDLLVARLAGTAALGMYAVSYGMVNSSVLFVIRPIGELLLPVLAKVRSETNKFTEAVLASISAFSAISWVITCSAWVLAEDIFVVLGKADSWVGAAPIFRALLPFVLIRGINNSMGGMLLAVGEPRLLTVVSGCQLVFMVPACVLGYWLSGFLGLTIGITVLNAGAMLALVFITPRYISSSFAKICLAIVAPLPAALAAALAVHLVRMIWANPILHLALGAIAAAACFLAIWELTTRSAYGRAASAVSLVELGQRVFRRTAVREAT
jgi:O-antigen/teichoic acid export membrane protein